LYVDTKPFHSLLLKIPYFLTVMLLFPLIIVEEDIDDGGTDDIKNTLLRCFMNITKEQGRGFAKAAPTTRSAGSRGKSQPMVPVVIPEEAEDVL
jgi:hypothetical protein